MTEHGYKHASPLVENGPLGVKMPPYPRSPFKAVDFPDFSGARAAGYFWVFAHAPSNKNLVDGRVLGRGWWIRKTGVLYTQSLGSAVGGYQNAGFCIHQCLGAKKAVSLGAA